MFFLTKYLSTFVGILRGEKMRFSSRAEYSVRALLFLALHYSEEPISLKQIAERENISFQYLEQIFPLLRKADLVESIRGTQGGYRLAFSPSQLTVGDVIRAVDGPIVPVRCLDEREERAVHCSQRDGCVTRILWEQLRDHLVNFLESITLEDMVQWSEQGISDLLQNKR